MELSRKQGKNMPPKARCARAWQAYNMFDLAFPIGYGFGVSY